MSVRIRSFAHLNINNRCAILLYICANTRALYCVSLTMSIFVNFFNLHTNARYKRRFSDEWELFLRRRLFPFTFIRVRRVLHKIKKKNVWPIAWLGGCYTFFFFFGIKLHKAMPYCELWRPRVHSQFFIICVWFSLGVYVFM